MYPTQHAAVTAISTLPLRAAGFGWRPLGLFTAGAVLIDVDHYLSYVWKTGDFSLLNAYQYHRHRMQRGAARLGLNFQLPSLWPRASRPFHAVSVLVGFCLLAWLVPALRPIAAGAIYHRLQDYLYESTRVGTGRKE
jgi:hypothetical protein